MNITFKSIHFKASEELENFVRDKVEKLFQQNERIIRADITLYEDAKGKLKSQFCEITLSLPGENLFTKKNDIKFEQATLAAVEALRKMMRRKKEAILSKKKIKAE
jgi:putative sigma-54 modulation protein